MFTRILRPAAALLLALSLLSPLTAAAEPGEAVDFLSYEEAVTYFDFDRAASNWCSAFGMDPYTRREEARQAILAGTDPALIIGLATFARDTGHGDEKLVATNAFRPACYQEILGLHDGNTYTGPYRNAMLWNGRSVTKFWWKAESAPGWPEDYALDLSRYDLDTLDARYFYRAALRLWDNTWVGDYYAKPGCSAHNSGTAIDITNYWIGANFDTSYTVNGKEYRMADYGLYKPLQPTAYSAGETWHITSAPTVTAMGNYDGAFAAGYEIVYALYYNPVSQGWSMYDGRGLYLGAGVTVIQIRLCQLGFLEQRYITGYFDTETDRAVRAFQRSIGQLSDGVCGTGTITALFDMPAAAPDDRSPELRSAAVTSVNTRGFLLQLSGGDDTALSAFRVDTQEAGQDVWVTRYYNAAASGTDVLDVDIWREGTYAVRAAARDAAGNESPLQDAGSVFVDMTAPRFRELTVSNITETGFDLTARAADNGTLRGFTVSLVSDEGETVEQFLLSDGSGAYPWEARGLEKGTWTITVTAQDSCGNTASYTFRWRFTAGETPNGQSVHWYGPANYYG